MAEKKIEEVIGEYRIIQKLNEGANGVIFLAEKAGEKFAIKQLKTKVESEIARFRQEYSTLARFSHENMVKAFDYGDINGTPYIVMESLEGCSLDKTLQDKKILSNTDCVSIIKSIAVALDQLHKNNLVYRDVKPANIFICSGGETKLIDFGLVGDIEKIVEEAALVGTPIYCAPEQSKIFKRPVDARSDLYSLGVTMFEMLTGRTPFIGNTSDILQQHASVAPPYLRELNKAVTPALSLIVQKLMAKDQDDRYQSALGLFHDLELLNEIDLSLQQGNPPRLGSKDKQARSAQIRYIERSVEEKLLFKPWSEASNGAPAFLLVKGAVGSGKTRLCEEFIQIAVKNSELLVKTKCRSLDKDIPLSALREAMDYILDDIRGLDKNEAEARLNVIRKAAVGLENELRIFSKHLAKILPDSVEDVQNETTSREEQQQQFLNRIAQFFINLSTQCSSFILFIDDIQWLDNTSLEVIRKIFESSKAKKLIVLGVGRSEDTSAPAINRVQQVLELYLKETIFVAPLSKDQTSALIKSYLGSKEVNPAILDSLYRRTGGNPFIAIEYLHAVINQGLLVFKRGDWYLDEQNLGTLDLSQGVSNLIIGRIDKSSAIAKKFLQYAVNYGEAFNAADVAHVCELQTSVSEEVLLECERLGLIERDGGSFWKFTQSRISEALLQNLEQSEKMSIVKKLADFFFQKENKSDEEIFATARLHRIADHKDNLEPALQSNKDAGFLALKNFAYEEVFYYLKFAYDLCKELKKSEPDYVDIAEKLSISATMTINWEVALESSDMCLRNAKDANSLANVLINKVWIMKTKGDLIAAQRYFIMAMKALNLDYPLYLQKKIIYLLHNLFFVLVAELLGSWYTNLIGNTAKLKGKENGILNLYVNALFCFTYSGKIIDSLLLSLNLVRLGYLTKNKKVLAFGYSSSGFMFSLFGLKNITVSFFDKSIGFASTLDEKFTLALCESRRLVALFFCGDTAALKSGFTKKRDFFKVHLDVMEYYRLLNYMCGPALTHHGHNQAAVEELDEQYKLQENNIIKCSEFALIAGMQNWIMNMEILYPNNPQLPATKARYMEIVNRLRKIPYAGTSASNKVLLESRYLETIDLQFNELMTAHADRNMIDPTRLHNSASIAIVGFRHFAKAKEGTEHYSLRHQFLHNMQNIAPNLFTSNGRSIFYFVMGCYYQKIGLFFVAEIFYKKSEKLADSLGNIRLLFDITKERARIRKQKGQVEAMKILLNGASRLASENGWGTVLTNLHQEFLEYLGPAGQTRESNSGATVSATVSATVQGTVQGRTAVGGGQNSSFLDSKMGAIEQQRYLEALLNISSAFTSSLDAVAQSKAVLKQIVNLFAAQRGLVFLKDENSGELTFLTGLNSQAEEISEPNGFSSTVVKRTLEKEKGLVIAGTDQAEAIGSESAVLYNLRSIMATPLTVKDGRVVGIVYLDSALSKGLFSERDLGLFSTLANHISMAFEISKMAKVEIEKVNLQKQLEIQSVIAVESKKVSVLVDNMQQALFSITEQGKIVEPVSKFSEKVFGREIVGQNVIDVFYADSKDKKQELDTTHTVLSTVFGEDDLQWSLMEGSLPKKVTLDSRVLKVQTAPIWNDSALLEKILFVVEDVTDIENLERQVLKQRQQAEIFEDILSNRFDELFDFLERSDQLLVSCSKLLLDLTPTALDTLLRDLHTMKGNSRLSKLRKLSEQIHNSETVIAENRENEEGLKGLVVTIQAELVNIKGAIEEYRSVLSRLSPAVSGAGSGQNINAASLDSLKKSIADLSSVIPALQFARVQKAMRQLSFKSMNQSMKKYEGMVRDIATELHKAVQFEIEGDAFIDDNLLNIIQDCMVHLLRNSIDHGLETTEERLIQGKPATGMIKIICKDSDDKINISIQDDGRGIDAEKILSIAIKKGVISHDEALRLSYKDKLALIFAPNFSSKDSANEISGRGIGMNVVKENIEKVGGILDINTNVGTGTTFLIEVKTAA